MTNLLYNKYSCTVDHANTSQTDRQTMTNLLHNEYSCTVDHANTSQTDRQTDRQTDND